MKPPFLAKNKKPLKVSAEAVFDAVKSIIEAGEEDEFLDECKGATVLVDADIVNKAKMHLFTRRAHKRSLMARSVVESARCPPDE